MTVVPITLWLFVGLNPVFSGMLHRFRRNLGMQPEDIEIGDIDHIDLAQERHRKRRDMLDVLQYIGEENVTKNKDLLLED